MFERLLRQFKRTTAACALLAILSLGLLPLGIVMALETQNFAWTDVATVGVLGAIVLGAVTAVRIRDQKVIAREVQQLSPEGYRKLEMNLEEDKRRGRI